MAISSNSSNSSSTGSQSTGSKSASSTSTSSKSTSSKTSSTGGVKASGTGATTSNSTGNFSGGLPGLGGQSYSSWSGSGSETAAAHASGVQGPGLSNGNFGSAWSGNGNSGSGSGSYTFHNTSYTNNKSEPVMTVDEVYGKTENAFGTSGNQSIVEKQGDYTASSNEKSGVESSTFGKQDNITVTPESITENKGLVDNAVIDSIEGLNFQHKDKESQDVLEARKSREDAESEDKANQMREAIKAKTDLTAEEAAKEFQIGDINEDVAAAKAKADEAEKAYKDLQAQADKKKAEKDAAFDNLDKAKADLVKALRNLPTDIDSDLVKKSDETFILSDGTDIAAELTYVGKDPDIIAAYDARNEAAKNLAQADITYVNKKSEYSSYAADLEYSKYKAEQASADYSSMIKEKFVDAPAPKPDAVPAAENTPDDTKQTFDNAIQNAIDNGADEQTVQAMTDIAASIEGTQTELQNAIAENNIPAYIDAQKRYNKNLNDALDIGNAITQTYYNKEFVAAVAKANDFEVTLADGRKMSYSEFATEMTTKSPEVAKAMYNAKADKLETDGHKVLAKIERAKAAMVGTWLGSKLTQADNQVRAQFNQMAKTDMRATYAAYNNVLNDTTGKYSDADKAEASAAINQANALMTASAALQASTGFFSGIGDSMSDGVYGTTGTLNAYQKVLNAIDNLTRITLGLGVTPGANKAYQNMYYLAGAKVNESGLYSKDFDSDGFALCQEYGNNAAAGMIAGAGELATGVALLFNPSMSGMGLNLVIDSITTFMNGLYGVQKEARKSEQYTQEVLGYFNDAKSIAEETGNKEALDAISNGVTQIENFELNQDKVGNLDNWLEGSGSNTATNEKFNQALSYDEWLKLIEADPTMQEYAKKLIAEKKEK